MSVARRSSARHVSRIACDDPGQDVDRLHRSRRFDLERGIEKHLIHPGESELERGFAARVLGIQALEEGDRLSFERGREPGSKSSRGGGLLELEADKSHDRHTVGIADDQIGGIGGERCLKLGQTSLGFSLSAKAETQASAIDQGSLRHR